MTAFRSSYFPVALHAISKLVQKLFIITGCLVSVCAAPHLCSSCKGLLRCSLRAEDAPCRAAVNAFAGALHCGLSGSMSLAVGPVGRQADATMQVRPFPPNTELRDACKYIREHAIQGCLRACAHPGLSPVVFGYAHFTPSYADCCLPHEMRAAQPCSAAISCMHQTWHCSCA